MHVYWCISRLCFGVKSQEEHMNTMQLCCATVCVEWMVALRWNWHSKIPPRSTIIYILYWVDMAKNCDPRNGKATTTKLVLAKCPKITCRKSYIGSSCAVMYTHRHFHICIEVAWFWFETKWAGTVQQDYSPTRSMHTWNTDHIF